MTDTISDSVVFKVRTVDDVWLTDGLQISFYIISAHTKQWPDNQPVDRLNTKQSLKSSSANQIHHDSLHRVVLMVGHAYSISFNSIGKSCKIMISQLTCCHLDAHMVLFCIEAGVEVNTMQLYAKSFT